MSVSVCRHVCDIACGVLSGGPPRVCRYDGGHCVPRVMDVFIRAVPQGSLGLTAALRSG